MVSGALVSNSVVLPAKTSMHDDHLRQSICRWCYNSTPLEELADRAKDLGLASIELLDPDEWPVVLKRGLTCAVSNGSALGITKGFNDPRNHDKLYHDFQQIIPRAREYGIEKIICFSGNRIGLDDAAGLENCARGLDKIVKLAEKNEVMIVMELLNSKVDHADYQCDHTAWGFQLVDKIGSDSFKLLYDIYHMQIMEGDIISTITGHKEYIAHFHTGGVPGRHEIDESQELNYGAIMQAIKGSGYRGFIGQEFIPSWKDPFEALARAMEICNV